MPHYGYRTAYLHHRTIRPTVMNMTSPPRDPHRNRSNVHTIFTSYRFRRGSGGRGRPPCRNLEGSSYPHEISYEVPQIKEQSPEEEQLPAESEERRPVSLPCRLRGRNGQEACHPRPSGRPRLEAELRIKDEPRDEDERRSRHVLDTMNPVLPSYDSYRPSRDSSAIDLPHDFNGNREPSLSYGANQITSDRYGDGEVTRYGAGESYRPFNRERPDRSPRSPPRRSPPPRRRSRTPVRDARDSRRSPPPTTSDSYVPGRTAVNRRRSRSPGRPVGGVGGVGGPGGPSGIGGGGGPAGIAGGDRYRTGGERWRARGRSRSRDRPSPAQRRFSPRRSPAGRRSPNRYSPQNNRDDRDRARSPPRIRDNRFPQRPMGSSYRAADSANPGFGRRRSRTPNGRDRDPGPPNTYRPRSPRRISPPPRSNTYRPGSRTPEQRRDDRYNPGASSNYRRSPPPRDLGISGMSSAMTSRSASRRNSPRPPSVRMRDDSPVRSLPPATPTTSIPVREAPRPAPSSTLPAASHQLPPHPDRTRTRTPTPARSPPRGPAALRAPPTGPSAIRNVSAPVVSPMLSQARQFPSSGTPSRPEMSPGMPPSGPRGFVPRGGFSSTPRGGGRGSWNSGPPRHMAPPVTPTGLSVSNNNSHGNNQSNTHGGNGIPTGPRAASISGPSSAASPAIPPKPFNPPTGPAATQHASVPPPPPRGGPSLAQKLMAELPQVVPGGKMDPRDTPMLYGIVKELEPHYLKLVQEEERIREELNAKREKLRKSLHQWNRIEREAQAATLRSELSEQALRNIAGEGESGAAF